MSTSRNTRLRRTVALAASATAIIATLSATAPSAAADNDDCSTVAWMDTSLSPEARTTALLEASTQHQKYRWLNEQAANSPQETTFSGVTYPTQVKCTPKVVYANGAEGVHRKPGTTAWPAPIAIAASFNTELGEQKAAIQGSEAFDGGNAVILGPGIASGRTPLSGRTPEYFGEDPLLSGLMGAAAIRGLEDGNPDKPVISNPKHFVANEQELDRRSSSSNVDERTLQQTYVLPYEIAISESDPDSLMCSYNQINGTWSCENDLMRTALKERIGFQGYIMSDFGAVHSTADSLNAGLDQELNRPIWFTPERLDAALAAGEITQATIDSAAFNVARAYINVGLFDHPVPEPGLTSLSTDEHKAVARELAEQSSVLLKNNDVLPLSETSTVAAIGPTASITATDGVSALNACSANGFRGQPVLNCDALIDPVTALTQRVEATGGKIVFDDGTDLTQAAATAADADLAIVFGYIGMGEFSDISDIRLDNNGDALVEAVAGAAEDTVVVLNSGTAVEMPWIGDVDAVVQSWYGGEQFGPALAALLFGDVNFSGKLPMSFPRSLADTPTSTPERYPGVFDDGSTVRPEGSEEIRQVSYGEGLEVGYKWYDSQGIAPLFAFGHGLSYTSFDYQELDVTTTNTDDGVAATVSFTITNTGDRVGTEVPQVYLTLPSAAHEPGKRLVGFNRVTLEAGESRHVQFVLDEGASNHPFSIWDEQTDMWTTIAGTYQVAVAASSRDVRLTADTAVNPSPEPTPTVTVTAQPSSTPTATTTTTVTAHPTQASGDLYETPGFHSVNGRKWMTVCEPYSQTQRCWTWIWATQVHDVHGRFVQTNGWTFNNLTYVASPKSLWSGNPLATSGTWTADDGRKWRTECETAQTGRNGCRSWAQSDVIEYTKTGYRRATKWVFNNIVRFS